MKDAIDMEDWGLTKEDILELEKEGVFVRIPDFYYKYSRINDNFLASVRENYFWLSKPTDFNDPFDARILLDTDNSVEEIDHHISKIFEGSELKEDARRIYRDLRTSHTALFHDFINVPYLNMVGSIGICCFTHTPSNLLMWAHYADNHKGVCIKYNFSKEEYISSILYPVDYSTDYPRVKFVAINNPGIYEQIFLTKSEDWKYEEEWRIVQTKHLRGVEGNDTEPTNYGRLAFQKDAIVEVFLDAVRPKRIFNG